MKNGFKQFGKAVCYYLLFLGMQLVVSFVFSFFCAIKVAAEAVSGGVGLDPATMTQDANEFMMQYLNLISVLSGVLTIAALWLFFLVRKKKLRKECGIAVLSGKYIPSIIVLGIALATLVSFVLAVLPENWLEAYAAQSDLLMGSSMIMIVISNMIVAPIVEEIIFRGLMLSRLRKAMPVAWAVLLSSLLFGLAHGQIVWIVYATALGVILSIVVIKTESLAASILLHMVFNIFGTIVPMVCADVSGDLIYVVIVVAAVAVAALLAGLLNEKKMAGE